MSTEALRLALEAMESFQTETNGLYEGEFEEEITAIKAALKAKDEPVAWRDAAIRLGEELSSVGPNGYYNMSAKEWLDWAMEQNPKGEHSLPQRTWVGLTNNEVNNFAAGCHLGNSVQGAIYKAEAKLKEKNT